MRRKLAGAAIALCLFGLIGGLLGTWPRPPRAYRVATELQLASSDLAEVRAEPTRLADIYARYADDFKEVLGDEFDDLSAREYQTAFCVLVANSLAPYGESQCIDFEQTRKAAALNCGNYGLLTIDLARVLPDAETDHSLRLVGWDGGAVGNHQILFLERKDGSLSLVLDPTIGLIGRASFDDVAMGEPIPHEHVVVFRRRDQMREFEETVARALLDGAFKASDLLYDFESKEHLTTRYGSPRDWPTPAARKWRRRHGTSNSAKNPVARNTTNRSP